MADEPEVAPEQEPEPKPAEEPKPEAESPPHPLEPGGKRFEQVYAERKAFEEQARQLAAEKARLEQELAATRQPTQPREYTDDELDQLEEQAQAQGDRATLRAVRAYRIRREAQAVVAAERVATQSRQIAQQVGQDLMQTFPALADPESELFKASASEYNLLMQEYLAAGRDIRQDFHATELAVGRALRRNPALARQILVEGTVAKPKPAAPADTHTEEPGAGAPASPAGEKGPKLSQRELDFCRKTGMDPKEYAKWRVTRPPRG